MEKCYVFTQDQLLDFLCEYCGCNFDRAGEDQLIKLLDQLAKEGKEVSSMHVSDTNEF